MKKLLIGCTAILLVAATWYLLYDESIPPPETESENLNELLRGAPVNTINIGGSTPDTLIISPQRVIKPSLSSDEMLQSFSSTQVKVFGDYLVTMEFLTANVAVYTLEGEYLQNIGGSEIRQAASLASDDENLHIYDYGTKEVHVYNADFMYQESYSFDSPYYTQGSLKMNEAHIAYQQEEASGFRVSDTDYNLLSVATVDRPDSIILQTIPRIVPSGKHPGGFNTLLFSMNRRSDIVVSYPALPFLFVYRNFEHYRSIVLRAEQFEEVENPKLTPFQPVMGEAVRINSLLDHLFLMDNGDILIYSFEQLHHLQLQRNGSYSHKQSYVLVRGDTGEKIRTVTSMDAARDQSRSLYMVSPGILFELELPG